MMLRTIAMMMMMTMTMMMRKRMMMMMRVAALHSQRGAGNRWGETQTRPRHWKPDTTEHNHASDDDDDEQFFDANDVNSGEVEIHKIRETQVNI